MVTRYSCLSPTCNLTHLQTIPGCLRCEAWSAGDDAQIYAGISILENPWEFGDSKCPQKIRYSTLWYHGFLAWRTTGQRGARLESALIIDGASWQHPSARMDGSWSRISMGMYRHERWFRNLSLQPWHERETIRQRGTTPSAFWSSAMSTLDHWWYGRRSWHPSYALISGR